MIILYGKLRKLFGKTINCNVSSVQELMRAAEANRPGFLASIDKKGEYIVRRGPALKTAEDVDEKELTMRFSPTTWHVVPVPTGYSGGLRILVGVALIVLAIWNPLAWTTAIPYIAGAGVGMALGGAVSLLSPMPKMSSSGSTEDDPSYVFSGPVNRADAGTAVALVYGFNVYVGSVFASGGFDIGDKV
jgi:predicted phage tail protein